MNNIFEEIREERERQDNKWGVQDHSPLVWDSILNEEAGEVSQAVLESFFDFMGDHKLKDYRKELIEVAAVAVAAIECLDRDEWDWAVTKNEKVKWKPVFGTYAVPMHSETGILYEVIATDGNIYRGYAMDWGFVPQGENDENTLEDKGEEIVFFREIDNG